MATYNRTFGHLASSPCEWESALEPRQKENEGFVAALAELVPSLFVITLFLLLVGFLAVEVKAHAVPFFHI